MPPETTATKPFDPDDADRIDAQLRDELGARNHEHWFRGKTTLAIDDDLLTVGVGSPFLSSWMQSHFREPVLRAAQAVLGPSARVRFEVDAQANLVPESATAANAPAQQTGMSHVPKTLSAALVPKSARKGTRRFAHLADFVEGPCNQLAVTAALQVAERPGFRFNPLFLHGTVGTGKTHLLEGIYCQLRRDFPALQVTFLTSEAFANYFTQALREHTLPSFRQRFRNLDVLLVDDIDFLDGKRATQEEFLHTFTQLESHDRQIVVTSDRHPRLLSKLSDELVTRFLSGLVCRIESPDFETRQQIVQRRAARLNGAVSPEALRYVAQRFKNNVRELLGAVNCLDTYQSMTGKRVGLSAARQVLSTLERDCPKIVHLADVEKAVCDFFRLRPQDLKSPRRNRSVSQPRMLAMFLARKHTGAAYSEIGKHFGGRNHSTVMAAERKVQSWLTDHSAIQVAAESWPVDDVLESLECRLQAG